jgi:hypothetical protein
MPDFLSGVCQNCNIALPAQDGLGVSAPSYDGRRMLWRWITEAASVIITPFLTLRDID